MEPLPQDLRNFENQLRAFVPQAPQTSREQLLYQAGWEAALAQHTAPTSTTSPVPLQKPQRSDSKPVQAHHYWAAACAALLLLSTTLGWQVWKQPQPSLVLPVVTAPPAVPREQTLAAPATSLASTEPSFDLVEPPSWETPTSALASYLDLRERVTRGGLSTWSVSTPVRAEQSDATQTPTRDWQAELLREAL